MHREKTEPLRIVHMPDPQLGFMEELETSLRRLKKAVNVIGSMDPAPDRVLVCGDMLHEATPANVLLFKEAVRPLGGLLRMVPGNHDIPENDIAGNTQSYCALYGADYWAEDVRGIRLLGINTQSLIYGDPETRDRQLRFIREELSRARDLRRPVLLAAHNPPFVKEADEADSYFNLPGVLRKELLELCVRSGVRFYLAGHTHVFMEKSYRGIPILAAETLVENFDKRPRGFRLLSLDTVSGSYRYDFVSV